MTTLGTTRRHMVRTLAAGLGVTPLVAACGAPNATGTSDAKPAAPTRYDGKVLMHWGSYGVPDRDALLKYYERFAEEQAPGLKVEIQTVTNAEYLPKLTATIVAGTPPDSARFKENLNNDLAARKNTFALDAYVAKDKNVKLADFTPQSVESLRYKDKLHGMPYYHQYVILGWNKELFKQAGLNPEKPPTTWAELRDTAKRLTIPDKGQWGFRLYEYGPPPREQIFNWFMEWVWRNGSDVWNKDRTRATLDTPEAIQALQTQVDMIYGDRSTIPPDQPQLAIETGKLGMYMPTAVGVLNLKKTAPDLIFGLGPMPWNKNPATQLQTNSLALMAGSKQLDLAYAAVSYMSREDIMLSWQAEPALSAVPVRRALLDRSPWSDANSGWRPIIDVLKMPGGRAKPHIPDWDEYTEKNIVPYLTAAWRQEKAPKDALTEAHRLANAWLEARPKT
jgi:multiple sugar transport system substrate-binding protein